MAQESGAVVATVLQWVILVADKREALKKLKI